MKEFHPFRLDTVNQCLWRRQDSGEEERVLLKPKPYAVLLYLADHAGRLDRFTPTHVGNPTAGTRNACSYSVHPHACGESTAHFAFLQR